MYTKVLAAVVVVLFIAYCQGAERNYGEICEPGDTCKDDTICEINKPCVNGTCGCPDDKVQDGSSNNCKDRTTTTTKKIGEACEGTSDCGNGTQCSTDKKCECKTEDPPLSVEGRTNTHCYRLVGDTCSTTGICFGGLSSGGECDSSTNKCKCKTGYKETDKWCWEYDTGDDCGTDGICESRSTCTDSKCVCKNDKVDYLDSCVHKDTTRNLGSGAECDGVESLASGKLCGEGLVCGTCPGDTSNKMICRDGATSVQVNLALIVLSAALFFFKL